MSKKHMTRKAIRNFPGVFRVYYVGDNDLQCLLRFERPVFYNAGVYGWNWDGYLLFDRSGRMIIINTGYRNMTGRKIPWEIAKKYNDLASGEHDKEKLNELLLDMFDELENLKKKTSKFPWVLDCIP